MIDDTVMIDDVDVDVHASSRLPPHPVVDGRWSIATTFIATHLLMMMMMLPFSGGGEVVVKVMMMMMMMMIVDDTVDDGGK